MEKRKGIRDLLEKQRYRPRHLQQSLIEKNIPGNWEGKSGVQNIYNLIDGRIVPKDAYIFIFLSEFLREDLRTVLLRYTKVEVNKEPSSW